MSGTAFSGMLVEDVDDSVPFHHASRDFIRIPTCGRMRAAVPQDLVAGADSFQRQELHDGDSIPHLVPRWSDSRRVCPPAAP